MTNNKKSGFEIMDIINRVPKTTGLKYRVLGRAFHFVSADDLNGRVFHETKNQYDKLNSICDALNNGLLNADDLKYVFTIK